MTLSVRGQALVISAGEEGVIPTSIGFAGGPTLQLAVPPSPQPCSSSPKGLAFRAWEQSGILGVGQNSLFILCSEALRLLVVPREAQQSCDELGTRQKPHVGPCWGRNSCPNTNVRLNFFPSLSTRH